MPSHRTPIETPADLEKGLAQATGLRYRARAEFDRLLNERQNRILGLSQKAGPNSDSYRNAEEDLARAKRDYGRINTGVHRPLNKWRIHAAILIGVGLLLAAFEAPVNKFLFDVALRSSNLMSWAISFAFACALLVLAHFAGVSLRHIWSDYRKRPVLGAILIFVVLAAVLFVLVSILTVARASFSANAGTIGDMFADVRQNVASVGLADVVQCFLRRLGAGTGDHQYRRHLHDDDARLLHPRLRQGLRCRVPRSRSLPQEDRPHQLRLHQGQGRDR